ncbi:MAG TPA: carbohydrate ABC transporter permease [Candidatus Eisenbergiella merdavium]|uniref:Carbohydrate ABC transporter permease n=1 Tax=Candidatus Eisenbergiella merdavium TaxID=2838551 RepID=A0A9D2NG98_9FIRM|nr:carbohydrate ABC transporter permease [Candidatus Eisenbergiella merdavium]
MKLKKKKRIRLADVLIMLFFILLAIITIYPFYYVLIMSLANAVATSKHVPYILPYVFDVTGYITIFEDLSFYRSLGVTLFVTIVGVAINMTLSIMGAYALSKKSLIGRNIFLYLILFTMLFSGGLVPGYLNIKNLGLVNSIWAMIVPTALSTYYMIIMKNYFISLPESLEEAARIDGANSFVILVKIIIPISMPFVATFALFYAVERWNEWYNALLYINQKRLQPLQIYLRELLVSMNNQLASQAQTMMSQTQKVLSSTVQMSCIIVTMVPILCVYPFVQKHFVKGIMIGGIKE